MTRAKFMPVQESKNMQVKAVQLVIDTTVGDAYGQNKPKQFSYMFSLDASKALRADLDKAITELESK